MNKKNLFTVFYFISVLTVFSQEDMPITMQNLEGIWMYLGTPEDPNTNNMYSITIMRSGKSLTFAYELEGERDWIYESYFGFQNYCSSDVDRINIENLKNSGKYYTEIRISSIGEDGFVDVPDFCTPEIIELTGSTLWINYGKVSIYERIDVLDAHTLKLLYLRGKQDHRNYIKEYLSIDVKEIVVPESIIYSEPDSPTTMHLIQGDIVTVLEGQDDWIKIEYAGEKLVTGWIKKEDVSD